MLKSKAENLRLMYRLKWRVSRIREEIESGGQVIGQITGLRKTVQAAVVAGAFRDQRQLGCENKGEETDRK
jgi:hypothetical protein